MTSIHEGVLRTRDGAQLAYRVLNKLSNAVPVVLINGVGGVKEDYNPLATRLASHRPVCLIDNRGMGQSTMGHPLPPFNRPLQVTVAQCARDVFDIIDHLGWSTINIIGHSMGGMITQQLLLLLRGAPNIQCRAAVLMCTTPSVQPTPAKSTMIDQLDEALKADPTLDETITYDKKKEKAASVMPLFFTKDYRNKNPNKIADLVQEVSKYRRPAETIKQQLIAVDDFDVVRELHLIPSTVQILVLSADKDVLCLPEQGRLIHSLIKHSQFFLVKNCGHAVYQTELDIVSNTINKFFADVEQSSTVKL